MPPPRPPPPGRRRPLGTVSPVPEPLDPPAAAPPGPSFRRYVAIGDSMTEGLDDPYPDGRGYRGWADLLAERLATVNPSLEYANLAVRGRLTAQVHDSQLEPALAMDPDLVSVVAGLNDCLRPQFELASVAGHLEAMQVACVERGATVLTLTLPDLSDFMPIARLARARIAEYNQAVREIAARTGAVLLDLAAEPLTADPRLFSVDRLHANAAGHRRIAAALGETLGLPDAERWWVEPLAPPEPISSARAVLNELEWAGRYLSPWVMRRLRGRSSGDGIVAKRPRLAPVRPPD